MCCSRVPVIPKPLRQLQTYVGITLNVQKADTATRNQLLSEGNFQMALTSHIGVGGDPDYLRRWYAGEETNAFAQGSIFHNDAYAKLGSLEFAKKVLKDARVAVSPGIGFGEYGENHVRIALIENEARTRQAVRGIKEMFRRDGLLRA